MNKVAKKKKPVKPDFVVSKEVAGDLIASLDEKSVDYSVLNPEGFWSGVEDCKLLVPSHSDRSRVRSLLQG
jgi:hypothetical protein